MDDSVQGSCWQPLEVRNTFIHGGLTRSPSLEAFYQERDVVSCPGNKSGCLDGLFQDEVVTFAESGQSASTTVTPMLTPRSGWSEAESNNTAQQHSMWQYMPQMLVPALAGGPMQQAMVMHDPVAYEAQALAVHDSSVSWPSAAMVVQPWVEELAPPQYMGAHAYAAPEPVPQAPPPAPNAGRTLVRLAETLLIDPCGGVAAAPEGPSHELARAAEPGSPPGEAAPGSAELPSVGSGQHDAGRCKPCAFVHSKGCADGVLCQFCHLCEPGEKKRRQREKLKCRKAAFRVRRAATGDF